MILNPRPCERKCARCKEWKHHSRFRTWKQRQSRYGTVSTKFAADCKACEQIIRNEKKNSDRPKAIIEARARAAATKAGVSFDFFWTQMGYRGLVPIMRAMMTDEDAICLGCGHRFANEPDIQLEHREPPRHRQDWGRLHAHNIGIACGSCNGGKGNKPYDQWLDDQEDRRLSNLAQPSQPSPKQGQLLFEFEE